MSIQRALWKPPYQDIESTGFPCPHCGKGTLHILDKKNLHIEEFAGSKDSHDSPGWEPDYTLKGYCALYQCSDKKCGEVSFCVGRITLREKIDYDNHGICGRSFVQEFWPKYWDTHLLICAVPKETPGLVAESLRKSYELYWSSPESSLNTLRRSVECLLDHFNIPKYSRNAGKRKRIPLHARLTKYEKDNAEAASMLMAIKWLGNVGSHSTEIKSVSHDTVLDSYDIFIQVLEDLFQAKVMKKLVRRINKRKGL